MMDNSTAEQIGTDGVGRRRLLSGATAGGIGAAVLASAGLALPGRARAQTTAYTDVDYINLLLNFEYLGAELYLHALYGTGLTAAQTSGTGKKGTVTAGGPVPYLTTAVREIVTKFAADEVAHVTTLRNRLGPSAIAEPTINLSSSWTTLALAAGFIAPGQTFDPFGNEVSLIGAAYIIEDVCVTALAGVVGVLTETADISTAAGFLGVEASQAAVARLLLATLGQGNVTDAISALRAKLSGAADDVGTSIPGNSYNFVSSDADGLVFARTPAQVLNIAYGGGAMSNFGFFPDRVNGVIQ